MNLDLAKLTYEDILRLLRRTDITPAERERLTCELRSRDRCLANQYKQICGA
jgi:hypothetical protein